MAWEAVESPPCLIKATFGQDASLTDEKLSPHAFARKRFLRLLAVELLHGIVQANVAHAVRELGETFLT